MTEQPLQLPTPNAEARQWAMFCHLAALLGLVFPFGSLLGPLVMWIWKKDVDPFVDAQGKEALNFQITVFIAGIICGLLMFVLIGIVLFGMLMIAVLILTIIAGVKANEGQPYRYPLTWRPIK
ncbi:DUF4870 domain-containing protein [Pseudomonas sp. BIGb0427]|uniref:DUF4870 domain-containing protein n=1 Tax=unclassified Pseudomonas TaxID=196821 RepID=UPI0016924603|nr:MULTISPECIES: DUF4870 domain-containing protein [unclassified Pseudomonas]NLU59677.1 DUF4870 domain-containing protein [Pseudomonas sp. BIGb0427]QPG64400.1 DUF4870 domain-containing protein [Pseudomonas sp. BIGb0427]UVM66841.1 DUF4870 domain-containing protein [Pseudomonas sp. B21-009]